ncbi:MAG: shikimate dehydrogenase, partial [Bacteroidales bacterium]|nr:shikimate dehydrogenase [Bacteroidales bacterium]
ISDLVSRLNELSLNGFNVTIPHKQTILPMLQEITTEAAAIGAVNTVFVDRIPGNVRLSGHNTDAGGFRMAIEEHRVPLTGQALILGTGGAAKAAGHVLHEAGTSFQYVSRTPGPGILSYEELSVDTIAGAQLIINATPLGMMPDTSSYPPIPFGGIHAGQYLFDMVYNPLETSFLQKGRSCGANIITGLGMLHHQADLALAWWLEKLGMGNT